MSNDSEILTIAKEHFLSVCNIPFSPNMPIDPGWQDNLKRAKEAIPNFSSVRQVIDYAQNLGKSGFNHRGHSNVEGIYQRIDLLRARFPEFNLFTSNLTESPLSKQESLAYLHGRCYSYIFFWHVNVALAIQPYILKSIHVPDKVSIHVPCNVLEIGGGTGELARLVHIANPYVRWIDVDLPTSLFFAEVFLRANFPECRFYYLTPEDIVDEINISYTLPKQRNYAIAKDAIVDMFAQQWAKAETLRQDAGINFIFIPASLYLKAREFGPYAVACNMGSMQEMPADTIKLYTDFIDDLNIPAFYSLNYQSTPFNVSPRWREVYRSTDPKVITVDCGVDCETIWEVPV